MKNIILAAIIGLSSLQAFAAPQIVWDCGNGDEIEGAGISYENGVLSGSISWDCWPGGGICEAGSNVIQQETTTGELVYTGRAFQLVINLAKRDSTGAYAAEIKATQLTGAADTGRGMGYSGTLTCSTK